jgi:hypothetical protein
MGGWVFHLAFGSFIICFPQHATHLLMLRTPRERKLSLTNARSLNKARKNLIAEAEGKHEVHWWDVMSAARIPKVHRTTASRAVKEVEPKLCWRAPREKPTLNKEHKAERVKACKEWEGLPANFFTHKVDLIIDNKKFAVPSCNNARAHLMMTKVRGHLRTPHEGVAVDK